MCSQVRRAGNPTNKGGLDEACLPVSRSEMGFNKIQINKTALPEADQTQCGGDLRICQLFGKLSHE